MHSNPKMFMAAQICHKGGKLEMKEVKWQEPRRGEIVVKVMACGVSHSDSITQDQLLDGIKYPRTPGHEFIGEVCAMGEGEMKCKMGDMVGGSWHGGHCMTCEPCRAGDYACCTGQQYNGVTRDGGMAEYVCMRADACVMCPKSMDPAEVTALMFRGATIFNSLNNMCVKAGELVAVHGAGGLGKLACDMSRSMGFRTVLIGEGDQLMREMNLASDCFIDCTKSDVAKELMHMGGAKVILCCIAESKRIPSFVGGLCHNGQLCLTNISGEPHCEVPMMPLVMRRLAICGQPAPTPIEVEQCLRFCQMADIRVKVNKMPLKECNKAWECAMRPDEMKKPVLMMA